MKINITKLKSGLQNIKVKEIPQLGLGLIKRYWGFSFVNKLKYIGILLLVLYLLGGIVVGTLVYAKKNHSKSVTYLLNIYPLPATRVNNQFISVKTIYRLVGYAERYSAQTNQKVDDYKTLRTRAEEQQIENTLVKRQAQSLNLSVTQKDVDATFQNNIIKEQGKCQDKCTPEQEKKSQEDVKKVLDTLYGMTVPDFKDLLRSQVYKDKLQQDGLQRVEVRHILVADEGKAKSIINDANHGGKSFEDSAKEFSKDSKSKDNGGSLGTISRGVMPANFDDVVFNKAEIGKTYPDPIKTDFGFHVIRVDKKTGKLAFSYQSWLDDAKKKAKISKYLK